MSNLANVAEAAHLAPRTHLGVRVQQPSTVFLGVRTILLMAAGFVISAVTAWTIELQSETWWRLQGLTLLSLLCGMLAATVVATSGHKVFSRDLFLVSFLVRLLAGLALAAYLQETQGKILFQGDAAFFHDRAVLLAAKGELWEVPAEAWLLRGGPTFVYAFLYSVMRDNSPVLSLMVNILVGALTPVVVWRVAQELVLDEKVARRAGWISALLPVTVIYSSTHLKEAMVAFCAVGLFYLVVTGSRRSLWASVLLSVPILTLLLSYRYRLGWIAIPVFLVGLVLERMNWRLTRMSRIAVLGFAVLLVTTWLRFGPEYLNPEMVGAERVLTGDWQRLSGAERSLTRPLGLLSGAQADPITVLLFAPVGAVYVLLLPLPWFALSDDMYFQIQLLSVANSAWLLLVPFFAIGCISLWRSQEFRQRQFVQLVLLAVLGLAFSLNSLTTFGRHREIVQPFLIVLAAAGLEHFQRWNATQRAGLLAAILLGMTQVTAVYFWTKNIFAMSIALLLPPISLALVLRSRVSRDRNWLV